MNKDIRDDLLEAVEDEFEGFAPSLGELEEFVEETIDGLADEYDEDVDFDEAMKIVRKNCEVPAPIEEVCHECGDPDCPGCYN